ncbi:MAG: hypothetical protein AABX23_01270 [Nanoarchaeota archaeon]
MTIQVDKWYSNGLTDEQVRKLTMEYARIEEPTFDFSHDWCRLQFKLKYKGYGEASWSLGDPKDIEELFARTNTCQPSQLEGKVVEAFCSGNMLKGLSVDKDLIFSASAWKKR